VSRGRESALEKVRGRWGLERGEEEK